MSSIVIIREGLEEKDLTTFKKIFLETKAIERRNCIYAKKARVNRK